MDLLCEKCRRLVETERCPFCGNPGMRAPENADLCFLTETDESGIAALTGKLEQSGIPFRTRMTRVGGIKTFCAFFVPYDRLDDGWSVIQKLLEENPPANADRGSGNELFTAEEIDRMEASMLDEMAPQDLKAYKNRIVKTLKEIRVQEQKWKQRTNILLDMKEEAECLIEDLS